MKHYRLPKVARYFWPLGLVAALGVAVLVLPPPAYTQTVTGSLSGTVTDPSGAVIPGASVTLTNEATAVTRTVQSNAAGYFSFTALSPSTYTLTVSSPGMATWKEAGIALNSQESRTVPNIALKVAAAKEEVTVQAAFVPVPLSTGASSTTLNNTMVSQLSVQGRDAAELIKLMPGMAINSGLGNTEWNSALTQINTGPIGVFSGSGSQPYGGMQMTMNGSVIVDAGNQGTQIANVNQDMTQEVTIQNASFDAEHAHGPITFSATGKTGTSGFHGELYTYTRNGSLSAENSFLKASGIPKPIDHYWYPGGNIGGPIRFPHSNFNKAGDKAHFFVGFEYLKQEPAGTLHKYMLPTAAMLQGNFTQSVLAPYGVDSGFASQVPCATSSAWNFHNFCGVSYGGAPGAIDQGLVTLYDVNGNVIPPATVDANEAAGVNTPAYGATISPSLIDPNGLALMKALLASPGLTPITPTLSAPFNVEYLDKPPVNSKELNINGDVYITPKMKAWASFTYQPETDINNIGVWWWAPDAVPYPSQMPASQLARDWSVGVTNTFSPSLVNEAVFGYAYFINPITLKNPSAVNPSTYGYNVPLPSSFPQSLNVPQLPNIVTWCCGIDGGAAGNVTSTAAGAGFSIPSFGAKWHGSGDFGKDSYTPDFSDSLTWIKGRHSMKFGFFWATYANVQTENCCGGGTPGTWDFDNYGSNTSFNYYADMLVGHAQGYSVVNTNPTDWVKYNEFDFFAQDSWKATRRMTINFGVRFERMGQWYPFNVDNQGLMVWDPNNPIQPYSATSTNPLAGFVWNSIDKSIPMSGWTSPAIYPDPRVGVAYDLFGKGKTVIRGGFGIYRFNVAYNDVTENDILSAPFGTRSFSSNCTFTTLSSLTTCGAAAAALRDSDTFAGLEPGDNATPYTETWNVMVDQRVPWNSILEVQYQGSRSRNMLISANGDGGVLQANINYPKPGSLFKPDPLAPGAKPNGATGLPNCYGAGAAELDGYSGNEASECSGGGDTFFCSGTPGPTCIPGGPPGGLVPDFFPYDYSGVYMFNHKSYSNYNALMLQWMKQTGPAVFNVNYTWSHTLGLRDGNSDNGQGAGASLDAFSLLDNYGTLAFDRRHIFNASYVFNLPKPVKGDTAAYKFAGGVVNGWTLSGDTQFQTGVPLQPLTNGNLRASYPAGVTNESVLGTNGIQLVPLLTCNPGKGLASGQYFNPSCFVSPSSANQGVNGPLVWPNIVGPGFFNSDLGIYKTFKITERQGLQFRFTMFNFLNHPLPQFSLTDDLNLVFSAPGGGNVNSTTTGKPAYTIGNRTIEFALKYTF